MAGLEVDDDGGGASIGGRGWLWQMGGCAMGGGGRWVRWRGKREKRNEGRKRDYRERE